MVGRAGNWKSKSIRDGASSASDIDAHAGGPTSPRSVVGNGRNHMKIRATSVASTPALTMNVSRFSVRSTWRSERTNNECGTIGADYRADRFRPRPTTQSYG